MEFKIHYVLFDKTKARVLDRWLACKSRDQRDGDASRLVNIAKNYMAEGRVEHAAVLEYDDEKIVGGHVMSYDIRADCGRVTGESVSATMAKLGMSLDEQVLIVEETLGRSLFARN